MCGVVGIVETKGQNGINRELLARMNGSLTHRGPDAEGFHIEPGVGFGHRRLSIIDLEGGRQPLYNEDETVVVTYNGEIYNYQSIRKELIALGHTFRTNSDTEVIVHSWEEWGEACVNRFNGMFAFGLWDRNVRTLFLARDRLGIKPLYYALLPGGQFVFGSELKALLVHPDLPRQINPQAVEDYFSFGYVPDPKSIFTHVNKLAPGHTLVFQPSKPRIAPRQYWDVSFSPIDFDNETELHGEIVHRLRTSVDRRLIAEVPLGAFLSGGVDSSSVVAMMAELRDTPVNTCSISFGDPKFNESEFAAKVASRFGTNHIVEQVEADDYSLIDKLVGFYDEPFADSSSIPTYRVCELARKKVTVALSGDGGDENFVGYRRYRWHANEERVRSRLPLWLRKPVFGLAGRIYPKLDWAPRYLRGKSTFQALTRNTVEGYLHSVSLFNDDMRRTLFSHGLHNDLQGYRSIEVFNEHAKNAPVTNPVALAQYLDFKTYLPGDILTKVDRASMANSLEVRVPILDHEFVDWVSGIPVGLKLKGGVGKHIFKQSLEQYLPRDILYRTKMGFAVPLAGWFRGPLRQRIRDAVQGPELAETGLFNADELTNLVNQHQSGRRDHSALLWSLLMFRGFHKNVMSS